MSESKKNNLIHLLTSLFKPKNEKHVLQSVSNKSAEEQKIFEQESAQHRIWRKEYNPLRQLVLWGWDDSGNPSLLILYGRHQFEKTVEAGKTVYHILENQVTYTSYAVFQGMDGHLPAFQSVKIIEEREEDCDDERNTEVMYYKKGIKYYYWRWKTDKDFLVKTFKCLEPSQQISLPYFASQSYNDYVQKIAASQAVFEGFKTASQPNEILKLQEGFHRYAEMITDMMSHPSLYIRKKRLSELLAMNPPREVLTLLLERGSTEVISGLFLELAKTGTPVLAEEAKALIESNIRWADEHYIQGLKRCIAVYLNALDDEKRADRIKNIRRTFNQMDLRLIRLNDKDIPHDKMIEGSVYRKYALQGLLKDYYGRYDYEVRRYIEYQSPKRYKEGPYTDGRNLKLIDFKNTIQEAEVYKLADVIGKTAYYLDAPRLTYYFKGSERTKAFKYFHRYIKRIINGYAASNKDLFMEAMQQLLTSYTSYDYVCKFKGNFQFNEFIKYYLYYDFAEQPPTGWDNWYARYQWMSDDQLLKLEGRHEFMKEIWDEHLSVAADLAAKSEVNTIVKACYFILKDSPNSQAFIENISYQQLISLALASYKPLSQMFMNILTNKLQNLKTFDSQLMIVMLGSADAKMHELAMHFFERTKGSFSPSDTADLFLLGNLDQFKDLLSQSLSALNENQYAAFVRCMLGKASQFAELKSSPSESILDLLMFSADKIQSAAEEDKLALLTDSIEQLAEGLKMPGWVSRFIEQTLFVMPLNELESLMLQIAFLPSKKAIPKENRQIIAMLESIKAKTLPSDAQIISILESGTSKMVSRLFDLVSQNSEVLSTRFTTLLIFFESEIAMLNQKAETVFDQMPAEQQKKMHGLIIDSPVPRAYRFGLKKLDSLYGDFIPEVFIIQMLEHSSAEVKAYIADKTNKILSHLDNISENLFMYYVKTLLLLPNRVSKSKDQIYQVIPAFVKVHNSQLAEIENLLLDIGCSDTIKDSERALTTLAKVREGGDLS